MRLITILTMLAVGFLSNGCLSEVEIHEPLIRLYNKSSMDIYVVVAFQIPSKYQQDYETLSDVFYYDANTGLFVYDRNYLNAVDGSYTKSVKFQGKQCVTWGSLFDYGVDRVYVGFFSNATMREKWIHSLDDRLPIKLQSFRQADIGSDAYELTFRITDDDLERDKINE